MEENQNLIDVIDENQLIEIPVDAVDKGDVADNLQDLENYLQQVEKETEAFVFGFDKLRETLYCSSLLMAQRQDLELKEEVMGKLELHEEWTELEVNESEGFIDGGSSESSFKEAFFPIHNEGHFYVVVLSLTKATTMTILDNSDSGATYAEKYEDTCELHKKLFARHLKINGHPRNSAIRKVKPRIPKLKWRTKKNFRDCGIFTMLHMESYTGEAATKWDCGLVAESTEQSDMLRRLRFKYATKILLHEINEHAGKMFELAKEFDKIPPSERMSIISEAVRNRDARECS